MLAGAPPGFLLGAATSAHQIEGGTRNDWTEWEKGHYPDGRPHVADGGNTARAADSWNLWRSDLAALQLLGRQRLPGGRRVEPPRARAWRVGRRRRRPLPRDVRGAARRRHRSVRDAVPLHAAAVGRGARRLGLGGRARGARRVRRARRRCVRRGGRLVVHNQRTERAGRQGLPVGGMAARGPRSAPRRARAGRADARARPDGGRAARARPRGCRRRRPRDPRRHRAEPSPVRCVFAQPG